MKSLLPLFAASLIFVSGTLFSQDSSQLRLLGKAEQASGELLDRNVRDANGEACAGLIVVSDLEGYSFDSNNGVLKVNHSAGRDLLFLSPGERVVTVAKAGYQPLRMVLSELGIRLRSGEVWQVKITGEKKAELLPVTILMEPTDATAFVDGTQLAAGRTHQLSVGRHVLKIESPGFATKIDTIDVSLKNAYFQFKLNELDQVAIIVRSIPPGAKILLDNQERGETNRGWLVFPEKYHLRLTKAGFDDLEQDIVVREGGENKFEFRLIRNGGCLAINVTPNGAKVLIDKEDQTGKDTIDVSPGRHRFEVSLEGYRDTAGVFELKKGDYGALNVTLVPRTGRLQFMISPPEASTTLLFDGEVISRWEGPRLLKDLPVGEYQLITELDGYVRLEKRAVVVEGKTTTEEITLEKGTNVEPAASKQPTSEGKPTAAKWPVLRIGCGYLHTWQYDVEGNGLGIQAEVGLSKVFGIVLDAEYISSVDLTSYAVGAGAYATWGGKSVSLKLKATLGTFSSNYSTTVNFGYGASSYSASSTDFSVSISAYASFHVSEFTSIDVGPEGWFIASGEKIGALRASVIFAIK